METLSKKKLTQEITQYILDQVAQSDDPDVVAAFGGNQYDVGHFFMQADSMRLRPLGNQLLRLFFDHEEFELDRVFTAGELLTLSKIMNAPYYIYANKKIVLYSAEHRVLLKLYPSVTSWLENFR